MTKKNYKDKYKDKDNDNDKDILRAPSKICDKAFFSELSKRFPFFVKLLHLVVKIGHPSNDKDKDI